MKAKTKKTKPATKRSTKLTAKLTAKLPKQPGVLRLTLPATSANLGPAFDAAALALDINFEIAAKPGQQIRRDGCFDERPPVAPERLRRAVNHFRPRHNSPSSL